MSRNARTPGPWKILPEEVDKDYIRVRGTVLGEKYKVANIPCVPGAPEIDVENSRADARLIAAAPELMEACVVAHRKLGKIYDANLDTSLTVGHEIDVLEAAIAKARGEA